MSKTQDEKDKSLTSKAYKNYLRDLGYGYKGSFIEYKEMKKKRKKK